MKAKRKGENQTLVRRYNQKLIIEEVLANATVSRADLAKKLNLSAPSISANVAPLIEAGILIEKRMTSATPREPSTAGRRPILLKFNENYGYVIGVDLSKGYVHQAIGNLTGKIVHKARGRRTGKLTGNDLLDLVEQEIHALLTETGIPPHKILTIAIASPGIMTQEKHVRLNPQQLNWKGIPVVDLLSNRLKIPVIIENDINLAAIGEYSFLRNNDTEQNIEQLLFVSVGRGLGSGLILNGQLYRGSSGGAGEIALMKIYTDQDGWQNAESLISIGAIRRELIRYGYGGPEQANEWDDQHLIHLIRDKLQAQDPVLLAIVTKLAEHLSLLINNLCAVVNPQLIVIGGEMMVLAEYILPVVQQKMKELSPFTLDIRLPHVLEEVGLIGSVDVARQHAIDYLIE